MTSAPGRIDRCRGCGLKLPLREPLPGELGRVWICARCGEAYLAMISLSASLASLANVRSERKVDAEVTIRVLAQKRDIGRHACHFT